MFFSGEFLCRFDYDGLFFQDGLFLLLYDGMDIKLVMGKVVDGMMFQVEEKIGILGFGEGGRVDEFGVVDLQCKLPLKLRHRQLEFSGFSSTLSTKRLPSIFEGFPFAVCG